MPRNSLVIDAKPVNFLVVDRKPGNFLVIDTKGKNNIVSGNENRLYTTTLTAGMYMGIPPFTYPETTSFDTPYAP